MAGLCVLCHILFPTYGKKTKKKKTKCQRTCIHLQIQFRKCEATVSSQLAQCKQGNGEAAPAVIKMHLPGEYTFGRDIQS